MYSEAEQYIIDLLGKGLPQSLTYHGVHHTLDVFNAAIPIAGYYQINGAELKLLRIAALYHDAGFLSQYDDHEDAGCILVRNTLPQFEFDQYEVDTVCQMIMATDVPQKPATLLEEILCDADLDYLGRDDFENIAATLYREFLYYKIVDSEESWNRLQHKFLSTHRYFTAYSRTVREPLKQLHLQRIGEIVNSYDRD